MHSDTSPIAVIGGGQSGLAAARAVTAAGLRPLVLEASGRAAGSWPDYYDSLTLFSPARFSAMPDLPFPGDPDRYPHRDEVVAYLERYAALLAERGIEIRLNSRVTGVRADGAGFVVQIEGGQELAVSGVVAASGARPLIPTLPGADTFTGELEHVAAYRNPKPYEGRRVVLVGAGNSAVQIGYELAEVADVTLASRQPVRLMPHRRHGQDVHYWAVTTGFDHLPPTWLARLVPGRLVNDPGPYDQALRDGRLRRRPMFTALDGDRVIWDDGASEHVDAVLLATGYVPSLGYLAGLGALDEAGMPLHVGGLSLTHPGLVYLGVEFQRSYASNTLRGVAADADHVVTALAAYAGGALAALGL
ncbi:NAD(P)/FAD-dependent oxidoreductase [Actinomadura sp. KC216]|uniref:flavin-containing monooxygenase n=1 Tax=Actinomadura sp. KC216 TaxID=2530370 RepID=UPI001051289A|nr:NAD(P)/FAD-dependent oxidoreductase [Actinomadura sp. KC216]TDB74301.1 NAD(P)/FAD-dependent oxidoreductase [Actinomadura sp. KC216]